MPKRETPSPIAPPRVRVFALTLMVEELCRVTVPVPTFRLFVPTKVKLPFKFSGLLVLKVSAAPEVLSIVPLLMVKALAPSAPALPIFKVPVVRLTPALMEFVPPRLRVPPVILTEPVMVLSPFKVAVPESPLGSVALTTKLFVPT